MLTSDPIAARRLRGLKWGSVVAALVAKPQLCAQDQPIQAGVTHIGSDACEACREDIYQAFLKSPHDQVDTEKHGRRKGLRSLPRSPAPSMPSWCRRPPVESLAKAHRRGLSEMSLQSAHTNCGSAARA